MSREAAAVYVVDDDVSVRESLRSLLRSVGLNVETFSTAEEFFASERPSSPGCLVLDVRMPGLSGLDVQARLAESHLAMPIIFITGHGDIPMSVRAIKNGAVEFLTKPFRDQDLLDAVRQAVELDGENRRGAQARSALRQRYDSLTRREQEVLGFVVRGLTNKQVAVKLRISEATVKLHRGQMMKKMGAASLADLVTMTQRMDAGEHQ